MLENNKIEIENSTCDKPLSVRYDNILTFDYHISELSKKLGNILLPRVSQHMNLSKMKMLMNTFFE